MAFVETPAPPLSDNQSTITAATANVWKRDIARAIDGTGGSDGVPYTNSTKIEIHGGLELGGSEPRLKYASRSLTRVQTGLLYNLTSDEGSPVSLSVAVGDLATQNLDRLPNGCSLTSVVVYHNRANTGVLPTTRLQVGIKKVAIATGTASDVVAITEDPTSTIAPYEAHHGITLTPGVPEVIDNTAYIYYLNIQGETSPNGTSTLLFPAIATFTVVEQDEAP